MDTQDTSTPSLELAVGLIALGLLLTTALQTFALFRAGSQLTAAQESQNQPIEQSQKIRTQLDGLASKTAKLAEQGNANAKTIIDDLKRQGITIKAAP